LTDSPAFSWRPRWSADRAYVPARLAVLVSGTGTNLQALLDACADQDFGADIVVVAADRPGTRAVKRAANAGVDTFDLRVGDYDERADWDRAFTDRVAAYEPDLVVSAGFMKLAGAAFLDRFRGRYVNTHPALLPAFPGMHAPRDALDHGAKVTGATLFVVDEGIDTGPIIAQTAVDIDDADTVESLHERIKAAERQMLVDTVGRMVRNGYTITGRKVTIP
jgi:phosphoribosylglycinamide formyltransferase 1